MEAEGNEYICVLYIMDVQCRELEGKVGEKIRPW
jgi:hypothetical protein